MSEINQALYSRIYKRCFIRFDQVKDIEELIRFCFDSFDGVTEPTCLLIIGDSGLGKSLIAELFHEQYPDYDENSVDEMNTIKPIVRFSFPSNAKRYEAIRAFLKAIGDPRWDSRDSFDIKNARLIHYLKTVCKTRLIIIDEFHHLTQAISITEITKSGEWLKLLIKETNIPVVGLGMPWAQRILTTNKQIGTIFTMVEEMFPFKVSDMEGMELYYNFLYTVSKKLNKDHQIKADSLVDPEISLPLFIASEGYPKDLMKMIGRACSLCGDAKLNSSHFEKTFKLSFASLKKNPFKSDYKDIPAKQIESHPSWDSSKDKIIPPKAKEINVRDVFNLGKSRGFF